MKILDKKTIAFLDEIFPNESPSVKAKIYSIVQASDLDPSDPMFLIFALTAQMKVFFEDAPRDVKAALSLVIENQEQLVNTIAQNISRASNNCVTDIREAGMAATSAIADANEETLTSARIASDKAREMISSISSLHASVQADRDNNEKVVKNLLEQASKNVKNLKYISQELNNFGANIRQLQENTIWVKFTDWFSPLSCLLVFGFISFGIGWKLRLTDYDLLSAKHDLLLLKHDDELNVVGREILGWNVDRYLKCQRDKNPKCTFWIVPPEQRK